MSNEELDLSEPKIKKEYEQLKSEALLGFIDSDSTVENYAYYQGYFSGLADMRDSLLNPEEPSIHQIKKGDK